MNFWKEENWLSISLGWHVTPAYTEGNERKLINNPPLTIFFKTHADCFWQLRHGFEILQNCNKTVRCNAVCFILFIEIVHLVYVCLRHIVSGFCVFWTVFFTELHMHAHTFITSSTELLKKKWLLRETFTHPFGTSTAKKNAWTKDTQTTNQTILSKRPRINYVHEK